MSFVVEYLPVAPSVVGTPFSSRISYVSSPASGPFVGQIMWGMGDTIRITNKGNRAGTITFSLGSQQTASDAQITVFSQAGGTVNLPPYNQSVNVTFNDRGFGTYVVSAGSRFQRQKITVIANLVPSDGGPAISSSFDILVAPRYHQADIYRQNGFTGERFVYSDYWGKVQPVNNVNKPLIISNVGTVPIILSVKDTPPTDFTAIGVRLMPGETRIFSPVLANYYYWAKVDFPSPGDPAAAVGKIAYIQAD